MSRLPTVPFGQVEVTRLVVGGNPFCGNSHFSAARSREMAAYWRYASQCTSLPNLQDWPAVRSLFGYRGETPPVFMPGHSLSHPLEPACPVAGLQDIPDAILGRHYRLWDWSHRSQQLKPILARRMLAILQRFPTASAEDAAAALHGWEILSRQALFIVNSNRTYEWFGAEWRVPLWDYRLTDFFLRVPIRLRLAKRFYIKATLKRILTGPVGALATIPIGRPGSWPGALRHRPRRAPAAMRRQRAQWAPRTLAKNLLRDLGLLPAARRMTGRSHRWHPMGLETWFSRGADPASLTAGEALRPYRVQHALPGSLLSIIRPSLSTRAHNVHCNGLLSAVLVARFYGAKSRDSP